MVRAFGRGSGLLLVLTACASPPERRAPPAGGTAGAAPAVDAASPLASRPAGRASGGWRRPGGERPVHAVPALASGLATVAHGGVRIGLRLAGARPVRGVRLGDETRYEGALGPGTALRLRPLPSGALEDLVDLDAPPPAGERLDYVLDVSAVAGLRQVGRVVEFLDAQGTPRLRMKAPTVAGADGRIARADVELGCAHDASPAAPWGRPVVGPGASECRLTVSWAGRGVSYPAVVDPVWQSTKNTMVQDRGLSTQGVLASKRVLVAGGSTCTAGDCVALASAELFDPATETWAATGPLGQARNRPVSVVVPGYGFLCLSGEELTVEASVPERYLEASGTWQPVAAMPEVRGEALAVLLADKKTVAVVGGLDASKNALFTAALFSTTTGTWKSGGTLLNPHYLGAAAALPDGRVMVTGGSTCANCGPLAGADLYDPATQTSTSHPMSTQRFNHVTGAVTVKGKVKVLAAGGGDPSSALFDLATKAWEPTGDMLGARVYSANHTLLDGTVLAAGGGIIPTIDAVASAERFDPETLTWKAAGDMKEPHAAAASIVLADGRVLVAGGASGKILTSTDTVDTASVFELQPQGASCQGSGECASRHCADGVCCDTACDGVCEACTAAKQAQGVDGVCGPVGVKQDPDDECLAESPTTCGRSGGCDGQGACLRYEVNTPCGPGTCTSGVSSGSLCTADGTCGPSTAACAPYLCKDPTACASSCASDAQCIASAHCEGSQCVADLPVGAACDRDAVCAQGACVDGFCCDGPCDGVCVACAAARKASGDGDGLCGPAAAGTDPHSTCADTPVSGCDQDGQCDGAGKCSLYPAGTPCQGATCEGSAATGFASSNGYVCDGQGTCGNATETAACGAFACRQGVCLTSCQQDADCLGQNYCLAGACVPRQPAGTACSEDRACADGFCVDGVCCASPCEGPCEACGEPGFLGICRPVEGQPRPGRPACDKAPTGRPCEERVCDGVVRTQCAGYVGSGVACRAAACADGVASSAEVCDGKGACPDATTRVCEPYVCGATECRKQEQGCASDADCAPRFQCDLAARDCIPRTVAVCDGDHTLTNPDGSRTPCGAYRCEGSVCKGRCESVNDCVLPSVCDEASQACVPPRPNPDDGACSAPAGPARPPGALALALLAGFAVLGRRARRSDRGLA